MNGRTRWEAWKTAATVAVLIGVTFSVLLMSVSFGVSRRIHEKLSGPEVKKYHVLPVDEINTILGILTTVVTVGMLCQTGAATFALGVTVMRSRREEVAIRRQSGVFRSQLLLEFMRDMFWPCVLGGVIGEVLGILLGVILSHTGKTPVPVRFNATSLLTPFPVTVAVAMAATLLPAWRAANASPAMLRRE